MLLIRNYKEEFKRLTCCTIGPSLRVALRAGRRLRTASQWRQTDYERQGAAPRVLPRFTANSHG